LAARALIILAALALQPSIGLAQTNIGRAASVRNLVEAILGGETHDLSSGKAIHSNELIRSGDAAVADLVFLDRTKLTVGPNSQVRLDKFVYDPAKRTGAVVIEATRGVYRFITGVQDPRSYEIKTPYATLGVRGTILEINLERIDRPTDGPCGNNVKIKLVKGAFVATTISGLTATIVEANTVLTVCSDGTFQTTRLTESILNFPTQFAEKPAPLSNAPRRTAPPSSGPQGEPSVASEPTAVEPLDPGLLAVLGTTGAILGLIFGQSPSSTPPVLPPTPH